LGGKRVKAVRVKGKEDGRKKKSHRADGEVGNALLRKNERRRRVKVVSERLSNLGTQKKEVGGRRFNHVPGIDFACLVSD